MFAHLINSRDISSLHFDRVTRLVKVNFCRSRVARRAWSRQIFRLTSILENIIYNLLAEEAFMMETRQHNIRAVIWIGDWGGWWVVYC